MRAPALLFALLLPPLQAADKPLADRWPVRERIKLHEKVLSVKYSGVPEIRLSGMVMSPVHLGYPLPYYCPLNDTIYAGVGGTDVLDHEIAHYYTDKVHESLGLGNFPVDGDCAYTDLGHRIVAEGIATYFQIRLAEHENPSDSVAVSPECMAAYDIVKPVLDESVRHGVECLLKNFPTDKDVADIDSYGKRAAVCAKESIQRRR